MEQKNKPYEKPKLTTKKINNIEISNFDVIVIRMICDYLFVDRLNDMATFTRFEQCFGPLFSDENNFSISEAFKEICGPKKKYITFRRMISAFLNWKSGKSKNKNFNFFMEKLFKSIVKKRDDVIGELEEGFQIFSTVNCQGRKAISKLGVFTDGAKNVIQGFLLRYDDCFNANLSYKTESETASLEINLKPFSIDEKYGQVYSNDRDGISHIAGKYDNENKVITFLIFKCRSGKTFYIGDNSKKNPEKVRPFLIGTSRSQLKHLRIETVKNQLIYLDPSFEQSLRINKNLDIPFDKIDEKFLKENEFIYEEKMLQTLKENDKDYDKNILIPCINDDAFMDKNNLIEEKFGKKFSEIYQKTGVNGNKIDFKEEKKIEEESIQKRKTLRIEEDKSLESNAKMLESAENVDEILAKIDKYAPK